jgi:hypothetical protein
MFYLNSFHIVTCSSGLNPGIPWKNSFVKFKNKFCTNMVLYIVIFIRKTALFLEKKNLDILNTGTY